jgi:leader peptidase (prepilin peptidase)/N-methyltransferase
MGAEMLSIWEPGAAVFGLIVGSFANVCIHRLPRRESVVLPASHCPRCDRPIRPWDNIPLLSYLFLLGRCRDCRARISPRYPAVEALNGLLYWGVAASSAPGPTAAVHMAFVTALLVLALIDLEHFMLPNVVTLPGIAVGFLASFLPDAPLSPLESGASAAGGFLLFALVGLGYQKLRGVEGLGQGDWKMVAMLGAFLGWRATLLTVLLASILGTIVGVALGLRGGRSVRQQRVPLGTFMALAAIAVVFVGQRILVWYGGFFRG